MAIRLHTHLKRLITKASVVGLSVKDVHKRINEHQTAQLKVFQWGEI